MKKRIIALLMTLIFVFAAVGMSFASQTADSGDAGESSGLSDLISGIGNSLGESSGNEDGEGDLSGIADLFTGITGKVKDAAGSIDTEGIIKGIAGFFSGLAESNSEKADEAEEAEEVPGEASEEAAEAAAEEDGEEINALNWEDLEEEVTEMGLKGEFVPFEEAGVEMWIPDILTPAQLPEDQPGAETFIGFYMTEEEDAYASVQFVPAEITLQEYKELLESLGDQIEGLEEYIINGQDFLVYFIPENDNMSLSTVVEGKGLAEFAFAPISDEEFGVYAEVMGVSIRPLN